MCGLAGLDHSETFWFVNDVVIIILTLKPWVNRVRATSFTGDVCSLFSWPDNACFNISRLAPAAADVHSPNSVYFTEEEREWSSRLTLGLQIKQLALLRCSWHHISASAPPSLNKTTKKLFSLILGFWPSLTLMQYCFIRDVRWAMKEQHRTFLWAGAYSIALWNYPPWLLIPKTICWWAL